MKNAWLPEAIRETLLSNLANAENPCYGQLSTTDPFGHPKIRTVHFKFFAHFGTVGWVANIRSGKWRQLSGNPQAAGCYFDPRTHRQWLFEGPTLSFITGNSQNAPEVENLIVEQWQTTRPLVRHTYWCDHLNLDPKGALPESHQGIYLDQPCPDFGLSVCQPEYWELLEFSEKGYNYNVRTGYIRQEQGWLGQDLALVSSRVLGTNDSQP